MIGLKRVLVPTDFSETSEAALKYGVALAGVFGGTLHVLHVGQDPMTEAWPGYSSRTSYLEAIEQLEADRRRHIEGMVPREEVATGRIVPVTTWGDPTEQILKYAVDHNIDLIVCGTHGRRGWDRFVMGSVAEKLVREAPCPVLTVHHPEHEFVLPDKVAEQAAGATA